MTRIRECPTIQRNIHFLDCDISFWNPQTQKMEKGNYRIYGCFGKGLKNSDCQKFIQKKQKDDTIVVTDFRPKTENRKMKIDYFVKNSTKG